MWYVIFWENLGYIYGLVSVLIIKYMVWLEFSKLNKMNIDYLK